MTPCRVLRKVGDADQRMVMSPARKPPRQAILLRHRACCLTTTERSRFAPFLECISPSMVPASLLARSSLRRGACACATTRQKRPMENRIVEEEEALIEHMDFMKRTADNSPEALREFVIRQIDEKRQKLKKLRTRSKTG